MPGGSAESHDESVLYSAARELWEEMQLVATKVNRLIPRGDIAGDGLLFLGRGSVDKLLPVLV